MVESVKPLAGAGPLERGLTRCRRHWQLGLGLGLGMQLLGLAAVLVAASAVGDYFLALPTAARVVLDLVVGGGLLGLLVAGLARITAHTNRDTAARVDQLLASRRWEVLSAHELATRLGASGVADGLQAYLAGQAVAQARERLQQVSWRRVMPWAELRRRGRVLGLQLLVPAVLVASHWAAAWVILERLTFPGRDVPPYSPFTFAVAPAQPHVVYGGDLELAATITGAPVAEQVWLCTRDHGQIHRAACFQGGGDRYLQRLEKLVQPVEFCFATGRARSRWQRVELRLQPQIAVVSAVVTPPAYTREPPQTVFIGTQEFAPRKGATVALSITSNRPLRDGTLTLQDLGVDQPTAAVAGVATGPRTVTFTWVARQPARIRAVIRDVQGTANRTPVEFTQQLTPDRKPEATMVEPAGFVLATPLVSVPLRVRVQDDLGLRRVDLVRGLVGYRDRPKELAAGLLPRELEFTEAANLAILGAAPGQVLEFYIEASDSNPDLSGVAVSDLVRIQVISEADYAELLRARTTVEEFLARYQLANERLAKLREALAAAKAAAAQPGADLAAALAAAEREARAAAEWFDRLGQDFPAFDAEQRLAQTLKAIAAAAAQGRERLAAAQPAAAAALTELMTSLMAALDGPGQELAQETAAAEQMAAAVRVMACAGQYLALYRRQCDLVRRLSRFTTTLAPGDAALLKALGDTQGQIRQELQRFQQELRDRAGQLSAEFTELRDSALAFADAVTRLQIAEAMAAATTATGTADGPQALRHATLAQERLAQLLAESCKGAFGGLCQGQMKFQVPKDWQQTLSQFLRALGQRWGGTGTGVGVGLGPGAGDPTSGGTSPLNVPVFGPSRLQLAGAGTGAGGGPGRGGPGAVAERERLVPGAPAPVAGQGTAKEPVPPRYAEALKRYFAEESAK